MAWSDPNPGLLSLKESAASSRRAQLGGTSREVDETQEWIQKLEPQMRSRKCERCYGGKTEEANSVLVCLKEGHFQRTRCGCLLLFHNVLGTTCHWPDEGFGSLGVHRGPACLGHNPVDWSQSTSRKSDRSKPTDIHTLNHRESQDGRRLTVFPIKTDTSSQHI